MKIFATLFLISNASFANWTNYPNPKGSAATKQDCEEVFGPPCFDLNGNQPDETALVSKDVEICDEEGKCETVTIQILEEDPAIIQAKEEAKKAEEEAKEDKLAADKLRLANIERLKTLTESGKLSEEEKDEAFRLALTVIFEEQKKATDRAEISALPVDTVKETEPVLKGRPK